MPPELGLIKGKDMENLAKMKKDSAAKTEDNKQQARKTEEQVAKLNAQNDKVQAELKEKEAK